MLIGQDKNKLQDDRGGKIAHPADAIRKKARPCSAERVGRIR